jgi:hypothetical protein
VWRELKEALYKHKKTLFGGEVQYKRGKKIGKDTRKYQKYGIFHGKI